MKHVRKGLPPEVAVMGDEDRAAAEARRQLTAKGAKPADTQRLARYVGAAMYVERPDRAAEHARQTPDAVGQSAEQPAPMPAAKPIVVGVDGSAFSRAALRWALDEASQLGCPVRAVMVWHAEPITAAGRPTPLAAGAALPTEPGAQQIQLLRSTVDEARAGSEDAVVDAELVCGSRPETLCAATKDARLLVLGSRGRNRMSETVLGSVSQYCVRNASCPVVVIPAQLAVPRQGTPAANRA